MMDRDHASFCSTPEMNTLIGTAIAFIIIIGCALTILILSYVKV